MFFKFQGIVFIQVVLEVVLCLARLTRTQQEIFDGCAVPTVVHGSYFYFGSAVTSGNVLPSYSDITLSCDRGYSAEFDEALTCTESGEWSPKPSGICVLDKGCPAYIVPSIANGRIESASDTGFGSARTIICNEGFVLVGDSKVKCQDNGVWTRPVAYCKEAATTTTTTTTESPYEILKRQILLCEAAANGDIDLVTQLLASAQSRLDVNWRDQRNVRAPDCMPVQYGTALHRAVSCNQSLAVVILLINSGASITAKENALGFTLLHYAAAFGNLAVSDVLLERGALINDVDASGRTALTEAAWNGQSSEVQFLIGNNANLEVAKENGETALKLAVIKRHAEVVLVLLNRGANTNVADSLGWTPLMECARNGDALIAKLLIYFGANVEARATRGYYKGFSAMMIAAASNNPSVIEVLKDNRASTVGCINTNRIFKNLCPP